VVISTVRVFPSRDERREVLGILRSVQGPTEAQPNCQSCRIYEEDGFEHAILYMERWDSETDFERHVRSELYRRILAALEVSQKRPEISFDYASKTRGMDLIEDLRNTPQQTEKHRE
jgi:quinol monooxygenase YgiN